MAVTALAPIIALLLLLPVLILGIVLFIVGLVKKKPAMWGSGIAVGVLGMLALVVGAAMFAFVGFRATSTRRMVRVQAQAQTQALINTPALSFHATTGLDLPDGVSVTRTTVSFSASARADRQTLVSICRMSVPADFDEFLAANFTKAKWPTVASTFRFGRRKRDSFLPSDSQLQAASLYVLTHQPDPDSTATFTTVVAHDASAQEAWVVSVEKPTSAE